MKNDPHTHKCLPEIVNEHLPAEVSNRRIFLSEKSLRNIKRAFTVAAVVAIIAVVSNLAGITSHIFSWIDRFSSDAIEERGLTPTGGRAAGSATVFDNEFGYITYGNLNRAYGFFALLESISHDPLHDFFGVYNEFEQFGINLVATNRGNYNIIITELTSRITNIEQINEPLILAVARKDVLNHTRGHEIVARVANHGWADAENVVISIIDNSGQLKNLIYNYPLSLNVGRMGSAEHVTEILLSNHMFVQQNIPNEGIYVSLDGVLSYIDVFGNHHEQKIYIEEFFLAPDGIRPPFTNGHGGGRFEYFGIFIDANQENVTFTRNTDVHLRPGELVDLPIRLFTNRSASFDLEVEITVNYSDTRTWAVFSGIELFISSIHGHSLIDGELLYRYVLEVDNIAFFPFSY